MKKVLVLLMAVLFLTTSVLPALSAEQEKKYGEHSMSGTISKIDHKTGMVTVKTGAGNLDVHFPPNDIKDLKEGDTITVNLSFTKGGMEKKEEKKQQ
jgi:hypothetical protein